MTRRRDKGSRYPQQEHPSPTNTDLRNRGVYHTCLLAAQSCCSTHHHEHLAAKNMGAQAPSYVGEALGGVMSCRCFVKAAIARRKAGVGCRGCCVSSLYMSFVPYPFFFGGGGSQELSVIALVKI